MSPKSESGIDPLRSGNYNMWKIEMESLLQSKGLYKFVTDRAEKLKVLYQDNPEKTEELCENDERALGLLKRNIDPSYIDIVVECSTALEVWKKLEQFFAGKENFNAVYLLQQLTMEKMKESGDIARDVQDFLQSKNNLVRRLASIGFKIEEKMQVALMLAQLPESFDTMRRILESKELNLDILTSELHRESTRRSSKRNIDQVAMLSSLEEDSLKKKKGRNTGRDELVCDYCGKKRHTAEVCWLNPESKFYKTSLVESITKKKDALKK